MPQFLNRLIDDTLGRVADSVLHLWDSSSVRGLRRSLTRMVRHRRAVIRCIERRMPTATIFERCWQIPLLTVIMLGRLVIGGARGFHRASRVIALLISRVQRSQFVANCQAGVRAVGRLVLRVIRAQADAWRWLGRSAMRLLGQRSADATAVGTGRKGKLAVDVAPTHATMPDGIMALMTCAACGHEVMGTNMKKYAKFRCPRCKAGLMVIDSAKGLSMQVVASDRRQVTRVEKTETEESEPVKL